MNFPHNSVVGYGVSIIRIILAYRCGILKSTQVWLTSVPIAVKWPLVQHEESWIIKHFLFRPIHVFKNSCLKWLKGCGKAGKKAQVSKYLPQDYNTDLEKYYVHICNDIEHANASIFILICIVFNFLWTLSCLLNLNLLSCYPVTFLQLCFFIILCLHPSTVFSSNIPGKASLVFYFSFLREITGS